LHMQRHAERKGGRPTQAALLAGDHQHHALIAMVTKLDRNALQCMRCVLCRSAPRHS
jgi:hypothetical protein